MHKRSSEADPPRGWTALVCQVFIIFEVPLSHSDTPHPVGLLCASDQPYTDTSLPDNTNPCPRRDTNPQSQKASCLGATS